MFALRLVGQNNMKPSFCEKCGKAVTIHEQNYSMRAFRKTLCAKKCQKEERLLTMPTKLAEFLNSTL